MKPDEIQRVLESVRTYNAVGPQSQSYADGFRAGLYCALYPNDGGIFDDEPPDEYISRIPANRHASALDALKEAWARKE